MTYIKGGVLSATQINKLAGGSESSSTSEKIFLISITSDENIEGAVLVSKTPEEILEAKNKNNLIIVHDHITNTTGVGMIISQRPLYDDTLYARGAGYDSSTDKIIGFDLSINLVTKDVTYNKTIGN